MSGESIGSFSRVCPLNLGAQTSLTEYGSQPAYPKRSQLKALFEQLIQHAHVS
ncbi:MAG: hypothetical protein RMY31_000625 [Dendronalium sp. ChiSLP03b]|nr:hypothetical protein [Dendronalium sp. ChiSLP03b]MDZ8207500.1 hypothetical protein [Dendronalium sp. ChiSLP03b]